MIPEDVIQKINDALRLWVAPRKEHAFQPMKLVIVEGTTFWITRTGRWSCIPFRSQINMSFMRIDMPRGATFSRYDQRTIMCIKALHLLGMIPDDVYTQFQDDMVMQDKAVSLLSSIEWHRKQLDRDFAQAVELGILPPGKEEAK